MLVKNLVIPQSASCYPAPQDNPLNYPGKRPSFSFLQVNEMIYPLQIEPGSHDTVQIDVIKDRVGSLAEINRFLHGLGVADLSKRYAVVGYGSNPVPGQLASKFGENTVVPVLLGSLENTDVVYNLISNFGYAFAEILVDQTNINSQIGITFLDDEQLQRMVETEQNYKLGFCPADIVLESGHLLAAKSIYCFVGIRKIWVPESLGYPVPIAELSSHRRSNQGLTQKNVLQLAIDEFKLAKENIFTPEQLIYRIRRESHLQEGPPKLKYRIQKRIEQSPVSWPSPAFAVPLIQERNTLRYFTGL